MFSGEIVTSLLNSLYFLSIGIMALHGDVKVKGEDLCMMQGFFSCASEFPGGRLDSCNMTTENFSWWSTHYRVWVKKRSNDWVVSRETIFWYFDCLAMPKNTCAHLSRREFGNCFGSFRNCMFCEFTWEN